jgi:hypothetical protein
MSKFKLSEVRQNRRCRAEDAPIVFGGPCPTKATYRCDFPGCDAEMCHRHAKLVRFGVHHCPKHA